MKLFINFILSTLVAFVCLLALPGVDSSDYYITALASIVLGIINVSIKPLLTLLSIIPTFLTIILSLFFFNGIVLIVMDWLVNGFTAESTLSVILFSAVLALLNWGLHKLIWKKKNP